MIRRALLLVALCACNTEPPTPLLTPPHQQVSAHGDTPRRGGILELATLGDVRSLDPASVVDGIAPELVELIFAGLVDYDANGNLVPDLAETYERSADGLHYDFHLRPALQFHNGAALRSYDVKGSIERALGPSAPNPSRDFFKSLLGYEDFVNGKTPHLEGVQTFGPLHVRLVLREPDATFERALPSLALRPVCATMESVWSANAHPCGAGPFELKRWERGNVIELTRFPAYHRRGLPYLDGVRMTLHVSMLSQRFRFERGEQHVLRELSAQDELAFASDPRWQPYVHQRAATQMNAEGMNTEVPPFDNVDVRRAVSFAIDREAYVKLRPYALTPLTQPVPQGVLGHNAKLGCQRYDLEEARRLMAKAGYPYDPLRKTGGYPHEIPYVAYRKGLTEYTAQLLKQQLAEIGLRLDLRMVSYSTYLALSHRRHGTAMSYQGWSMDFSDPSNFTETLFHSSAIADDDANNTAFYNNRALDQLLDQAKRELDEPRRLALYDRAQQILCDDAPWAFTYSIRWTLLTQPFVRGFAPHAMWMYDLSHTWLGAPDPKVAR